MLKLAWDVQELTAINDMVRTILVECQVLLDELNDLIYDAVEDNLARRLACLREKITSLVKRVSRYRRTPASHLLVMMISTEDRRRKPYAMPVQCLAYRSLKDAEIRKIANQVVQEMKKRGLKVAGFTTNGEWNSLHQRGNTRPLSVLQLRSIARSKYSRMGYQTMMNMLTPRGMTYSYI
jgi:hypothetical protein